MNTLFDVEEAKKSFLDELDLQDKIELKRIKSDLSAFAVAKKSMTPTVKWEAFDKIFDSQITFSREKLIELANYIIRNEQ